MAYLHHSVNVRSLRATATDRGSPGCTRNQRDASQLQQSIQLGVRATERKAGWDFQTGICLSISLGSVESTHWATYTWPLGYVLRCPADRFPHVYPTLENNNYSTLM